VGEDFEKGCLQSNNQNARKKKKGRDYLSRREATRSGEYRGCDGTSGEEKRLKYCGKTGMRTGRGKRP